MNLLLIATASVMAYLLTELIIRFLDVPPRPMAPLSASSYQLSDDPLILFEYIPGTYDPSRGFKINSAGFRDHEYEQSKSEGSYRILVMGDSTTAGIGVPDLDDTYTKILERRLNALGTSARVFEVLNMGVGGYQTMQEIQTLRNKGLAYDPDLVLVTVCINDFDLHADGGIYRWLERLERDSTRKSDSGLLGAILRHSRLAFVIYHRIRGYLNGDRDRWYVDNVLKGRTPLEAGLELLSELQQAHGFPVRVLILPSFSVPFDEYEFMEFHGRVADAARGLPGITVIDLLEWFSNREDDTVGLSYDGLHLNEKGHRVIAEFLLPVVERIASQSGSNH
jgi:lysophospholipase L1-like esterase